MQVQKGLVKYKDRSDILCTYGITEDGKTYYFLEGNTISNGNIVATTVLVEAIDPLVVSSSIGVIDPNGNVVIPFENKAVKPLTNDLLLVEKATPVTDSVIEAVELRSDPSAASKLVSTPAAIKENMHIKMGDTGRFVFNDQFSEATICDINGNNLVNDELFSFIGLNDERMFLSKNVVGSFIWEFDVVNKKLDVMPEPEVEIKMGDGDASEFTVDVSQIPMVEASTEVSTEFDVEIPQYNMNLEGGFAPEDVVVVPTPEVATETVVSVEASTEGTEVNEVSEEESKVVALDAEPVASDEVVTTEEVVEVDTEPETEINTEAVTESETEPETEAEPITESETEPETEMDTEPETEVETEPETEVETEPETESVIEETTEAFAKDLFASTAEEDIFANARLHEDRIVTSSMDEEDAYEGFTYFPEHSSKDSLVQEVSATINELVKLNKSQRQKIISYEQRMDQMADANRKMNDKLREQSRDYEKLRSTAENFKTVVGKLEAKCEVLEGKNEALEAKAHDQERTIYRLTAENTSLREQNLSNEALAQVLAEARSALETDEGEMGYYRKAA